MAVLIDPPRWPAHGTVFGHLVSDVSVTELWDFAIAAGLPVQAFDHDHFDVPQERYAALVAAGAEPVNERELVKRLIASGLRVRDSEKTPTREKARQYALTAWQQYDLDPNLGAEILSRWEDPARHYHDVRHLAQCLMALAELGSSTREVALAAWFHDAVYNGVAGQDEEDSAQLAERVLAGLIPASEVAEVARLVRMTATHQPTDEAAVLLNDADLSILGQVPGRYQVYLRDVRLDYAQLSDEQWRTGRLAVVTELLGAQLFHSKRAMTLWARNAETNLRDEQSRLLPTQRS